MKPLNKQIISVGFEDPNSNIALFSFHDINNSSLDTIIDNEMSFCGKNGFAKNKSEGDMMTPIGIFKILFGFGTLIDKKLKIDYDIIDKQVWVDDPNSELYNTMQCKNDNKKWKSAEKLDIPCYKYCLATGYNYYNPIKGKGSAIFIHCTSSNNYTAGCVAIKENVLLKTIYLLDKNKDPEIIIDTINNVNKYINSICKK